MSKNKRKNKKISKKSSGNQNEIKNGIINGLTQNKKEILDDNSVKKLTVTMETPNGSTITSTEEKNNNGSIKRGINVGNNSNFEKINEHFHAEKNDYMEVNIDKYDDKEIKSVTRTTKNSDGTITKKITVVTTFPDGSLETKHTEESFDPNQKKEISECNENKDKQNNSSNQKKNEEKVESEFKKEILETDVKQENSSKFTRVVSKNSEPLYSDLPSILSALPDYLVVIKSNENLNNKSYVKVPSADLDSGVFYNSDKFEIMSSDEAVNFKKLINDYRDLGSEVMSKHVNLLNYYGNVSIEKLKENLLLHLNSRNIFVRESDLDKCLNTIDQNSDGELNYIEFVDFFCLFFSTKNTIRKNLLSILNEHNISHCDNGYLNSEEAKKYFNLLRNFFTFENNAEFPHRISYGAFVSFCLPFIENKLFFK